MKRITTTALLTAVLFTSNLQAQNDHVVVDGRSPFAFDKVYENGPAPYSKSQKLTLSEVSTKAIRSFKSYFNDSESPAWYDANGQYLAKFNHGNRNTSALFAKDGRLLYALSYGTEQDLPDNIRHIIKTAYEDHKIGAVIEVHAMQQHAWIINLESYGRLLVVRYMDGQLDVLKSFTKQ